MKKILKYIALISTALMAANFALAGQATTTPPQEESFQKENQSLRLEIFDKVLNLSIKETEDIINQLKALENLDEKNSSFRNQLLDKFNGFLKFYEEQKKNFENPEEVDLAEIKSLAQSFKDWRENVYLPAFKTATDFLLINQQKIALEITEKRHKKISVDVKKLKRINLKGSGELEKFSEQAANSIKDARDLYQEAENSFWSMLETASTTASSTDLIVTSPTSTPAATTTIPAVEETGENQILILSIKNLIGQSLNKIKEAYQIFIEMSNFVKKLLI